MIFMQTSHYCILVHLSWILIKTRRQDLIITIPEKSTISTNFIIPPQIFNQFEYVSSNLHLVLSSLTTLTTSATQFIRNPLGTITRVPAYFQLPLLRRCPLQLQPTFSCAWCTELSSFKKLIWDVHAEWI